METNAQTFSASEIPFDEFETKREERREALYGCQQERGLTSCFICDRLFDCKTRSDYIDAVYASMNKGKAGGFEF
ncbi:MAG: hypothetical protein LBF86_03595 [Helicobacteraceae bacterium]|jgi:hypothetical protein|nr:hypothetical protein [Helicobacteraceae bacterium]